VTKDITRPETLHGIGDEEDGTGIYWFVDGSGLFEQVFVPSIKRKRAEELAGDFNVAGRQRLDAYRWVPNRLQDEQSLLSSGCSGSCDRDLDCVNNACRCIDGECRRK
jgi:hypothetical protein